MIAKREYSYRKTWQSGWVVGLDVTLRRDMLQVRNIVPLDFVNEWCANNIEGGLVDIARIPKEHQERFSGKQLCYANSYTLHLDALRKSNSFADSSIYVITCAWDHAIFYGVHNRLALSLGSRESFNDQLAFRAWKPVVSIYIPFVEATFDEMGIWVALSPEQFLISTGADFVLRDLQYPSAVPHLVGDLPRISLESDTGTVPADGSVSFRIKVLEAENDIIIDHPFDIYLESNAGYLPKRKVRCNGEAVGTVSALGLSGGDAIRVKAGFRYLTNCAHLDFIVSDREERI